MHTRCIATTIIATIGAVHLANFLSRYEPPGSTVLRAPPNKPTQMIAFAGDDAAAATPRINFLDIQGNLLWDWQELSKLGTT